MIGRGPDCWQTKWHSDCTRSWKIDFGFHLKRRSIAVRSCQPAEAINRTAQFEHRKKKF